MSYLSLNDKVFDRTLSLRDAYRLLETFVSQYNARGDSSTIDMLTDIGVVDDGSTSDPAQLYDFLRVSGQVLADPSLTQAAARDTAG